MGLPLYAEDGQDEVSLDGTTTVIEVGDDQQSYHRWTASDFGLLPGGHEALSAPNPAASADIIRRLFAGEPGPCRDTVIAGTAAALFLTGKAISLQNGATIAGDAIDQGAAADKLAQVAGACAAATGGHER